MTILKILGTGVAGSIIGGIGFAVMEDDELFIVRGMIGSMLGGIAGMTIGVLAFAR